MFWLTKKGAIFEDELDKFTGRIFGVDEIMTELTEMVEKLGHKLWDIKIIEEKYIKISFNQSSVEFPIEILGDGTIRMSSFESEVV